MLTKLELKNFTVFREENLDLAAGLNVFVGENGTGKSHLLKLIYALAHVGAESGKDESRQTKTWLSKAVGDKLVNVFRPDYLGRLVRRGTGGRQRAEITAKFRKGRRPVHRPVINLRFSFATNSKTDVTVDEVGSTFPEQSPIFFPTREVISIFPGFAALYRDRHIEFDETYYDLCLALEGTPLRGRRAEEIKSLIEPLEQALEGRVTLENGRFYLKLPGQGNLEMHLVAEGVRKLAMLTYLIVNGSLRDRGMLLWDEPETNLNPALIRLVARAILSLCQSGIQVFVATHSLFLLRELEILADSEEFANVPTRYVALGRGEDGVSVSQGDHVEDIEPLVVLDEDLRQSDRYLEKEVKHVAER